MQILALVFLLGSLFIIGLAAHFISLGVYRSLIRAGYPDPVVMRVVTFIASFIVIFLIAGWILLSALRFSR
jgi:hypothetical protein